FQQSVVNHSQGHARVVAVAGAGKTTTLAHFIRARLEAGTSARRILVLMYNKSAQVDFERRLSQLVESHRPEVRTFHSLGLKIYQRLVADGDLPAFQRDLISESEMEGQVWRMLQQVAEDDETRQDILSQRKKWVEPAVGFIDRVKAGLDSPELVFEALELPTRCRIFIELFERFESWRQSQRRITFADMIYDPVRYLTANSSRAAAFGNHMEWLLVDEYQDINAIQQALLDLLRGERGQVVVIGDPDQTIYEFRGSRPEYMTSEFERRYGSASSYQLPHSFRYGHQVALLANHLIHHNSRRAEVVNVPAAGTPLTRVFRHTSVDGEESSKILSVIQAALANHQPDEIAVICRLWALCAPVELALLQAGLPYQSYTRNTVLDRWELRIFWILFDIASGRFVQRSESERLDAWLTLLTTPFPKIRRADLETLAQNLSHCTSRLGAELQRHIPQSLSRWQKQQLEVRAELIDVAEFGDGSAYRLANDYFEQTELDEGIRDSAF
ncbi:MAG: ATP-dependent helicase, partial [Oceanobacter sp.]